MDIFDLRLPVTTLISSSFKSLMVRIYVFELKKFGTNSQMVGHSFVFCIKSVSVLLFELRGRLMVSNERNKDIFKTAHFYRNVEFIKSKSPISAICSMISSHFYLCRLFSKTDQITKFFIINFV